MERWRIAYPRSKHPLSHNVSYGPLRRVKTSIEALLEVLKWCWDVHYEEKKEHHPIGEEWLAGVEVVEDCVASVGHPPAALGIAMQR